MPRVIEDYIAGKTVVGGEPVAVKPQRVTVISTKEAPEFFGTRSQQELIRHLRGCRDLGLMLTRPGQLTRGVKTDATDEKGYVIKESCYVFTCPAEEIPRKRRQRSRVLYW